MPLELAVCDYPEQVPSEEWAVFPKQMRELGLSYVRIGEFAWSKLEPRDGEYHFAWLDAAIDALHAEGLKVVLGTPTATPPAWLVRAHPGILPVDVHGRVRDFGSRRHYDFSSDVYWQHSARIVEVLAKRYGNHAAVVGWQTDNEYGCHDTTRSYSEQAKMKFRGWLEQKHGSLEALNAAWGTVFWSQEYTAWAEIGLPNLTVTEANPCHVLDFYRFSSDQVVAYDRMQTEIIRTHSPNRFVTHNYMIFFSDFDHYKAAAHLDFVTWDNYPTGMLEFFAPPGTLEAVKTAFARTGHPDLVALNHDVYRGLKNKAFWVMEQQCGQVNWSPYNPLPAPGAVQLWTLQAMAHGADVVSFFRWQAAREAQEDYHSGLLRHDSSEDRGFAEVKRLAPHLPLLSDVLEPHRVCLLHDYESLWAYDVQKHNASSSYWAQTLMFYTELRQLGVDVDVVHPFADLSAYSLIIAPALIIGSVELAAHLDQFVAKGATVVFGTRTGFRTSTGAVPKENPMTKLAGVRVKNFDSLRPGLTSRIEAFDQSFTTHTWNESLEVLDENVRILGSFFDDPLYNEAGITYLPKNSGGIMYIGVWGETILRRCLEYALFRAGIKHQELETGLRLTKRGGLVYAQNWTRGGISLPLEPDTEFIFGDSLIPPYGVTVYKAEK
jgi:beta-galactosidase